MSRNGSFTGRGVVALPLETIQRHKHIGIVVTNSSASTDVLHYRVMIVRTKIALKETVMTKILVAYASKHHSTAEIAEEIARELRRSPNHIVDIREVDDVESLVPYDAVVVGSAVYSGNWQPNAANFLTRHELELSRRWVWLFSSGPTGQGDPAALAHGWIFPHALQSVADRIAPRDFAVFGGKIETEQFAELNVVQRSLLKVVHPPLGDFRDWTAIRAWASRISRELSLQVTS